MRRCSRGALRRAAAGPARRRLRAAVRAPGGAATSASAPPRRFPSRRSSSATARCTSRGRGSSSGRSRSGSSCSCAAGRAPSSAATPTSCARSPTASRSRSRTGGCTGARPSSSSACAASTTSRRSWRARSSWTSSAGASRRSSCPRCPSQGCALSVVRLGALEGLSRAGVAGSRGRLAGPRPPGSRHLGRAGRRSRARRSRGTEAHETLEHLLGIAALALEKALLYERSQEQARRDSLTGLLGHQAFQERLEGLVARDEPLQRRAPRHRRLQAGQRPPRPPVGDETLRRVAEAMRGARAIDRRALPRSAARSSASCCATSARDEGVRRSPSGCAAASPGHADGVRRSR